MTSGFSFCPSGNKIHGRWTSSLPSIMDKFQTKCHTINPYRTSITQTTFKILYKGYFLYESHFNPKLETD